MSESDMTRRQFAAIAAVGTTQSLLTCSPGMAGDAAQPGVRMVADTVIDQAALNFVSGPWGTCINGQTFQEHAVASCQGHQYATYFHGSGRLAVARRKLPDGPWERIYFDDYTIHHNDVHNVAVLGICPGDGTIHLAFDHHNHPLHYRVSKRSVVSRPDGLKWEASLFGPTTSMLDGATRLERLTYPMFAPGWHGGLLLYYRIGGSGDGDWYLTEYDPTDSRWSRPLAFLSKDGSFQGSDSRCAYLNGLQYDSRGRLHVTWCWRETPDLQTNHDLMYAYSDDRGRTWQNNAGETIGRSGPSPVNVESSGIIVAPIAFGWGMMNQLTQDVDGQGRVHAVVWRNPPDAPKPNHDLNAWRFYHHWRDESGQWHGQALPFFGRKPRLVVDASGDALMVFNKGPDLEYHGREQGGKLHVAAATAKSQWTDWRVVFTSDRDFVGEPRVDLLRWRSERQLSVYVQQKPEQPGNPSPLRLIEFEPHF
ncbi:MAG: BNR repeat-containing protein [Planctomycetes bacterium]|nr:BNR repeat-containing protein [Planctomycetota bacterium]